MSWREHEDMIATEVSLSARANPPLKKKWQYFSAAVAEPSQGRRGEKLRKLPVLWSGAATAKERSHAKATNRFSSERISG